MDDTQGVLMLEKKKRCHSVTWNYMQDQIVKAQRPIKWSLFYAILLKLHFCIPVFGANIKWRALLKAYTQSE